MFVYTLAKAARKGYLPATYRPIAEKGWQGIQKKFFSNQSTLEGTVSVSGLGGSPYRDGSYNYYISEKVVPNDPKGVGAFLLAADEMQMKPPSGKTVFLDEYYNNEHHKDITGTDVRFHYIWDEMDNNGYAIWGGNI